MSEKQSPALVQAASKVRLEDAQIKGYLKKLNREGKWQKRYFAVLDQYFVYYKNDSSTNILCALDLTRSSEPAMADPKDVDGSESAFTLSWDRKRYFRASSRADAQQWVSVMKDVRLRFAASGDGDRTKEWGSPKKSSSTRGASSSGADGGSSKSGGDGCCEIM